MRKEYQIGDLSTGWLSTYEDVDIPLLTDEEWHAIQNGLEFRDKIRETIRRLQGQIDSHPKMQLERKVELALDAYSGILSDSRAEKQAQEVARTLLLPGCEQESVNKQIPLVTVFERIDQMGLAGKHSVLLLISAVISDLVDGEQVKLGTTKDETRSLYFKKEYQD